MQVIQIECQNRISYFILLLCMLLLAGCSGSGQTKDEKKPVAAPNQDEVAVKDDKEEIPVAARELEGMIAQAAGKLVEEHVDPKVEVLPAWDYFEYSGKFDEEAFQAIVEKEIQKYFEKNKDLTNDQIYDYLVHQLGSGQYQSLYEQLISYDHGYVMPDLPDGEDEIEIAKKQKTNVVMLMDASGSMKGSVDGGVKMDLAKEAIKQFTSQLQEDVNISLLVYGHIGSGKESDRAKSCQAIETIYPLSSYQSTQLNEAMNAFQASGWTPLAGAIEKANELLAAYPNDAYKNIVYIVSDGIETCDGNPVEVAKKLNESNIEAKVNIIGFDVDDEGQKQLKQVAEAGGGEYVTVRDKSEFEDVIVKKWQPSLMQVLSQQGVLLNDVVDQKQRLIDIHNPLIQVSDREANRVIKAINFLKNNKLISDEAGNAVKEKTEELQELRNHHFNTVKEEKEAEAKKAYDEIEARVKEWREKWFDVLEKE